MKFTKMHGNGNDFIVIEDFDNGLLGKEKDLSKRLCNRNFGIGGDGLILLRNSNMADIKMDIFNADGSYASMCGNGIRCFAKYVYSEGICLKNPIAIETGDGVKEAVLKIEEKTIADITINMGKPSFHSEIINRELVVEGKKYTITAFHMGVPHAVIFGISDDYDVCEGRAIEKHSIFPNRTNVNFCEVINKNEIKVKTWERGAGSTLACGTGSCASVIAANKMGLVDKEVQVYLPGGSLKINITPEGIMMTGPAEIVFKGEIDT
ncbi:diaminopimelate epimerase [Clostridium malenominatum]|uniref:Diaminopimelate epimerase n=1 Tax=Clostridium malenominatum TaxID=1539 RepID=A0ABP3U7X0_9CLOT